MIIIGSIIGTVIVKKIVELISTEYVRLFISPFSNNSFIITMLVLSFTVNPKPIIIDFFFPRVFFPTRYDEITFAISVIMIIVIISIASWLIILRLVLMPTHNRNIGARNP